MNERAKRKSVVAVVVFLTVSFGSASAQTPPSNTTVLSDENWKDNLILQYALGPAGRAAYQEFLNGLNVDPSIGSSHFSQPPLGVASLLVVPVDVDRVVGFDRVTQPDGTVTSQPRVLDATSRGRRVVIRLRLVDDHDNNPSTPPETSFMQVYTFFENPAVVLYLANRGMIDPGTVASDIDFRSEAKPENGVERVEATYQAANVKDGSALWLEVEYLLRPERPRSYVPNPATSSTLLAAPGFTQRLFPNLKRLLSHERRIQYNIKTASFDDSLGVKLEASFPGNALLTALFGDPELELKSISRDDRVNRYYVPD